MEPRRRWRPQVLPLAVSFGGLIAFFMLTARAAPFRAPIWFDGPIFGIEQAIGNGLAYQARALLTPPYFVITHPPLSYLLAYPLFAAGGGAPSMRLLNVLSILIDAGLVYVLVRRTMGGTRAAAWFAATLFLMLPPVFRWSQLIRCPDALSCCFDLCIVLLLLQAPQSMRREVLVGLLFVLAAMSKQSALLTFFPVLMLEPLFTRQAIRLTAVRITAVIVPLSIFTWFMQRATGGGFLTNVVDANIMQANYGTWLRDVVLELGFFWLLAVVVLRMSKGAPKLVLSWFLLSALAGLATDWKDGANSLYFFEASASLATLAGYALDRAVKTDRGTCVRRCTALAALAVLILSWSDAQAWVMSDPEQAVQYGDLVRFLRARQNKNTTVLTQDASVSVAMGEPIVWNDALVLGALERRGKWDDRRIVAGLENGGYYAAVGLVDHYWTPAMKAALTKRYYAAAVFGGTFAHVVYLPKPQSGLGIALGPARGTNRQSYVE